MQIKNFFCAFDKDEENRPNVTCSLYKTFIAKKNLKILLIIQGYNPNCIVLQYIRMTTEQNKLKKQESNMYFCV